MISFRTFLSGPNQTFGLFSTILFVWIVLLSICQHQNVLGLDLDECINPLGMENGDIPDSAITASSSYDMDSVGPENGRIRKEQGGGAWCPLSQIKDGVYEYLQIDLGKLKVITKVETQGRFGNGMGMEFVSHYTLKYQREDEGPWIPFRDRASSEVFTGNTNVYLAVARDVKPPIIAKRIRFVPYSKVAVTVCLRVEMYGCGWNDSLVSYSLPQGHSMETNNINFYDFPYDGDEEDKYLRNGLGQLTDGDLGDFNFQLHTKNTGDKGFEWVGWKNDSSDAKPVEIVFKFDSVRNFSQMAIHCSNHFSRDVRVFRKAEISNSIGGTHFSPNTTRFHYVKDSFFEYSRFIVINLHNQIGRYLKVELHFQAKWILLSEISFTSDPAVGNFLEETPPTTTPTGDQAKNVNSVQTRLDRWIFSIGLMLALWT